MTRTSARIVLTALLVAVALAAQWMAYRVQPQVARLLATVPNGPDGYVLVTTVVDGDTIELEDGSRVRYIGVDTPETVHPTKPVGCFGPQASAQNASLVEGKYVRMERDITDTDRYGRLLRYVYLEDGTFVNLQLVADGYAYAYTYPPDIAHAARFKAAQAVARQEGRGLWGACPVK